jgi:hypothetical protein
MSLTGKYFKMQMRRGSTASDTNDADLLASGDHLTFIDQKFLQVSVAGMGTVRVQDHHRQAIAAATPGYFNCAGTGSNNNISPSGAFLQIYSIVCFPSSRAKK